MAFTVRDARAEAAAATSAGDLGRALEIWDHILAAHPNDHEARLRIADLLLAGNAREAALTTYRALADHAMDAGHPLTAVVAIKAMGELDAGLSYEDALARLCDLFAAGSPRLGKNATRQAPVDLDAPLAPLPGEGGAPPADAAAAKAARKAAADRAAHRALDFSGVPPAPKELFPVPFLSDLDRDVLIAVIRAVPIRRFATGAYVVRAGEAGDSFFLVAGGELGVVGRAGSGPATELARLREGALFGEMALVTGQKRLATVVAAGQAEVVEISREVLAAVGRRLPGALAAVGRFTRERLLKNLFASSPLFRPFSPAQRAELLRHFEGTEVAAGTEVIAEGEAGDGLYVVLSGEVEVRKGGQGPDALPLARLGAGEMFGEMALLRGSATTASVRTTMPSALLFLHRTYFTRLVDALPELRQTFEELALRREAATAAAVAAQGAAALEGEDIAVDDDDVVAV